MNNNEKFNYTYSAAQHQEIKMIRDKYAAPERSENKMEQLRRLDKSAVKPGTIISLIVGVLGTLILGIGMSMCMVLGNEMFIPGIVIGIAGMIGVIVAYPIYNAVTKKRREKLAPEIMRLTEELMK